jgi:AAA15 family ATPase/GTPase
MYFVIFKKKSEDKYRLYTNTIFSEEKEAKEFAKKSMKRNEQYKVVEYTIENIDDYWY